MGTRFDEQTTLSRSTLMPPLATRDWIRELYNAEVRDVDSNVGRLIEHLKQLHLYDEALIVLSSDHGEEFWEHGRQGHGQSLYPEQLEVPLIVKLPRSETRMHVPALVSTMSITPTVLELCGIPVKPDDFSAPSLGPLLKSGSAPVTPPVVSSVVWTVGSLSEEQQAVGFDDFHFIDAPIAGKEELFDRRADAGEQHSVAASAGEQVAAGKRFLSEHAQRARALRTRLQIERGELGLDAETSKRLRTLGYVH
jgi:arylsulfatase A-like enzyme